MKISNFNNVKNQFLIESENGMLFQSYESAIALIDKNGITHLSEHWDYSMTTNKHRCKFLNESGSETKKKIKSGEYRMDLSIDGEIII